MSKVSFDGINRTIKILPNNTNLDVGADIYSEWKRWLSSSPSNRKYLQAFRTFGGDPTGASQYAPRYFFLLNDWRVIVDNMAVTVQTNLYTENGDSPFVIVNGGAVTSRTNDVPIVKSVIDESLDYKGEVIIDATSVYSGTAYPTGTAAQPVNNIDDALDIAHKYSLSVIKITKGNFTVTQDISGFSVLGNATSVSLTIDSAANVDGTYFNLVALQGDFNGKSIYANTCHMYNCDNINGYLQECGLYGTIKVANSIHLISSRCMLDSYQYPVIDMNTNTNTFVNVRGYYGELKITNCDTASSVATLDISAGSVKLDSTCSAGSIYLRGIVAIEDLSTGASIDKTAVSTLKKPLDKQAPTWDTSIGITDTYQDIDGLHILWGSASDDSGEAKYKVYISDNLATLWDAPVGSYYGNALILTKDANNLQNGITYYVGVRATDIYDNTTTNTNYLTFTYSDTDQLDLIEYKVNTLLQNMNTLLDVEQGNWEIKNNQMIFYSRDNSPLMTFNLYDKNGNPSELNVYKRENIT